MICASRLVRAFFDRYTPTVARDLLGCSLVRVLKGERLAGRIVETEAYRGSRDPASHAYVGVTRRNSVMFGRPGFSYVYFIYGFHYCLNVTTERAGTPGAVLIRAVEPTEGVDAMVANRGRTVHLTDGPGRLTQAFGIGKELDGVDLVRSKVLFFERGPRPERVSSGPRIGVGRGAERKWRFFTQAISDSSC